MRYQIRTIVASDYPLLCDFLYEAIFVPEGTEPPPRSILALPELQVYVDGFGSGADDHALLAEVDGSAVGAVWVRMMQDYGHLDDQTPSMAIALYAPYRGLGIGTALMQRMLDRLGECGYAKVSLSVQKQNAAFRLYQRLGFAIVKETEEEYLMVCHLPTR